MLQVENLEVEFTSCDKCKTVLRTRLVERKHYFYDTPNIVTCIGCGKVYCYNCSLETNLKYFMSYSYADDVDRSGCYCPDCNKKLSEAGDPLYDKYIAIERLIRKRKKLTEDLDQELYRLERDLKDIYENR